VTKRRQLAPFAHCNIIGESWLWRKAPETPFS